jgi:hypothetical protein
VPTAETRRMRRPNAEPKESETHDTAARIQGPHTRTPAQQPEPRTTTRRGAPQHQRTRSIPGGLTTWMGRTETWGPRVSEMPSVASQRKEHEDTAMRLLGASPQYGQESHTMNPKQPPSNPTA